MRGALQVSVARASRANSSRGRVAIYVPRQFRFGALDGVPMGAAIVGTPRIGGTLAIDFQATDHVAPSLQAWSNWVADAACRHLGERENDWRHTEVIPTEIRLVGHYEAEQVTVDEAGRALLWCWLNAGRASFMLKENSLH